jgi:CRP-like cAMP-binding protein
MALLFKAVRSASISCPAKNCEFLIMKPALYRKTLHKMKMEEAAKNAEAIRAVPMFSSLTNKQKHLLANTIKVVVFHADEVVFRAGDDAQAMYIITEGNIKIEIEGKQDILLNAGEMFGEASLEENMKRSGTAIAISKAVCSMISRKEI